MAEQNGDFAVMLSSDMIAEIVGRHFNEEMFKHAVEIVDLKPTNDGYVFNLTYKIEEKVDNSKNVARILVPIEPPIQSTNGVQQGRNNKGKFTKSTT